MLEPYDACTKGASLINLGSTKCTFSQKNIDRLVLSNSEFTIKIPPHLKSVAILYHVKYIRLYSPKVAIKKRVIINNTIDLI